MGLRINTNLSAVTALRNLRLSSKSQQASLQRLSTGLRINQASDDPSGLVISEQLRAQIASTEQAIENTQFNSNLISTAEAGLQEIQTLLVKVRESSIFAMNTGGASEEQIEAEQDAVDSAIQSIQRIASFTRFGRENLLNGAQQYTTSQVATAVTDFTLRSVFFGNQANVTFTAIVTQSAQRANFQAGNFSAAGGRLRISGTLGTEDVFINSSITTAQVLDAVNSVREFTGVYGSGGSFFSDQFGGDEQISLEVIAGSYNSNTQTAGSLTRDAGQNIGVQLDGAQVSGDGLDIRVNSNFIKGEFRFEQNTALTSHTFTVLRSGMNFQLGNEPNAVDQLSVGLPSVDPKLLGFEQVTLANGGGTIGGFLDSLIAGGANDLKSGARNAVRILDRALDQINGLRGFLGALVSDTLDPNSRSLGIAVENLQATESSIRDLDFAAETANFTRTQVLFSAGTSVLASANVLPQTVLSLLQ
jgi:flagellin